MSRPYVERTHGRARSLRAGAACCAATKEVGVRLVLYVFGGLAFGPGIVGVGEDQAFG